MKKIITLSIVCLLATACFAQVPDVMNYQAVARNNAGQALASQTIKVRLSITKNAVTLYSETRQVTTNALGLFNVQIGSSGAISTTGNFSTINWQNNPTTHFLKVELDINNSGLFTDMGSQALVSVPYAFASKKADEATETVNIAGRPIDQTTAPTVGSRLSWDGINWTPVKKDTVYSLGQSPTTVVAGGSNAPWAFCTVPATAITLTGSERVIASISSALGHNSSTPVTASISVCYQSTVPGSPIVEFTPLLYPEIQIMPGTVTERTFVSSTGAATLPAGTYRIGLGVKNRSNTANLNNNAFAHGFVEIKY